MQEILAETDNLKFPQTNIDESCWLCGIIGSHTEKECSERYWQSIEGRSDFQPTDEEKRDLDYEYFADIAIQSMREVV